MKFKIKIKQVIPPYEELEFTIDAYTPYMAQRIFEITYPEYDKPEYHIWVEKIRE